MVFVTNKFKVGDKVIVKSTIGIENAVQQVVCFGKEYTDFGKHYCEYYSLSGNPDVRYHESCLELWNPKTDLEGGYKMKEFEIGKTYKTENGCNAQLLHTNAFGQFEGMLKYENKSGAILTTWDKNGYCISGLDVKNEYKLVREVEMKEISMNKKYRTRDSRDVELITINSKLDKPIVGIVDGETHTRGWHMNGLWSFLEDDLSQFDLMEVNPYADFKIDDKVLVRISNGDYIKRYFAGVDENGNPTVFANGHMSWASNGYLNHYKWLIKLEDIKDNMVICDD